MSQTVKIKSVSLNWAKIKREYRMNKTILVGESMEWGILYFKWYHLKMFKYRFKYHFSAN